MKRFPRFVLLGCIFSPAWALSWKTTEIRQTPQPGQSQIVAEFPFHNDGASPVRITSVTSSCDCTAAKPEKELYAPGESGVIRVEFVPGERQGPQEKTVTVVSDDAPNKPAVLTLRVDLPELVVIQPRMVFWRLGEGAEEKTISIRTPQPGGLKVESVRTNDPSISTRLKQDETDGTWRLALKPSHTDKPLQAVALLQVIVDGRTRSEIVHVLVK